MSDFLTGAELSPSQLGAILDRASAHKADRRVIDSLAGKTIALIFDRPSTRTRMSAEIAVRELGGFPMILSGGDMQISRGESVRDTALVTDRFVHAIGVRTGPHATAETLAHFAEAPVFNLLTEEHHPCQALADLLTLRERFGTDLTGRRLAYLGDGNNVTTSLMVLGAIAGVSVVVATPQGYAPDSNAVELARSIAVAGAVIELTTDPISAVTGADAVYTDVWVSMGDQDSELRGRELAPYQLNELLLAAASPEVVALHCLPAHVGQEITEAVLYGPRSAVFDQAENRLHVQKALLEHLIV